MSGGVVRGDGPGAGSGAWPGTGAAVSSRTGVDVCLVVGGVVVSFDGGSVSGAVDDNDKPLVGGRVGLDTGGEEVSRTGVEA